MAPGGLSPLDWTDSSAASVPSLRSPAPTYQPSQLFTKAPDVILEFLLFDPPLSLVDLTAQVPLGPWGVAIGFQQQYPQFVQAPGGEGGQRTATVTPTLQLSAKCLETATLRGRLALKQHQKGSEWKHEA